MFFIADTVAHSSVELKGAELIFVVSNRADKMALESDLPRIAAELLGRPVKVTAKIGTPAVTAAVVAPPPPNSSQDAELSERALSHPEVKRFTELFPEAHVRNVRNLRE